jgi:hypothetical protein
LKRASTVGTDGSAGVLRRGPPVPNAVGVIGGRATSGTSYTPSGGPSCLRLNGTCEGDGDRVLEGRVVRGEGESHDETGDVTSSPAGWSVVTIWLVLVLLGCLAVSMLAFMAAVRVLDIRVRWWRVIAGLLLLRISNSAMTPVLPWVQHVWASVWGP